MGARLLIGATDGIGLELARRWKARGEPAYLHGRRPIRSGPGAGLDPALFEGARYVHPTSPIRRRPSASRASSTPGGSPTSSSLS